MLASLIARDELRIEAAESIKFFVCSALDHVAVIHYDDLVAVTYGGKTVSNNDAGNSSVLDGLYDLVFGLGIKCRGCFVTATGKKPAR